MAHLRPLTVGSLSVLLCNINGIQQRKTELDVLLHDKRIDIALISETHLTANSKLYIPDYTIHRSDHPDGTAHGGTAILIKSTLKHDIHPTVLTAQIQVTAIAIHTHNRSITIAAIYCPPRHTISSGMFTELFNSLGPNFLVGGDWNAKHIQWGSRVCTTRGRNLLTAVRQNSLDYFSPDSFTYWPTSRTKQPDLLDFFICKGLRGIPHKISCSDDLMSDHSPISLILWVDPLKVPHRASLTGGLMDWTKFRSVLTTNLQVPLALKTEEELENAVQFFTETVQGAALSSCTPISEHKKHLPAYPGYIRVLIRDKRKARKAKQANPTPTNRQSYNRLNNELKRLIQLHKKKTFETYTSNLNTDDGSLWRSTKRVLKHGSVSMPLRREDGTWAVSESEKADIFSKHLEQTFTPNDTPGNTEHESHIHKSLDIPLPLSLPPHSFTPSEVYEEIKHLPRKKAPGHDLITAKVLQEMPRKAVVYLTTLYNAVLRTTKFPLQWKYSHIVMIQKINKPSHCASSYRPISLLPICSKVLEKLLYKRILSFINDSNTLPNHQFGFRLHHSTTHQMHRVVDYIASAFENKQYVSAVFLDVAQAFDKVWHQGLLFKLRSILPPTYYLILHSFLTDRFFSVRTGNELSTPLPIRAGVPQGSILAPLLYITYTSDAPTTTEVLEADFADDKALLTTDTDPQTATNTLQAHINLLQHWCTLWKIQINEHKSQHITFTLRRATCPPIYFNNISIPQTNEVQYLGLILDRRLTWKPHIRKKRITLNTRLKLLSHLLNNSSSLQLRHRLNIYKYLLKPIWTYGSQIYGIAKKTNIDTIQKFQSKTLRIITRAPPYVSNYTLHKDLNMLTVTDQIKQHYTRFHQKLHGHPNPLIHIISTPHFTQNTLRRLRRSWMRDLLN